MYKNCYCFANTLFVIFFSINYHLMAKKLPSLQVMVTKTKAYFGFGFGYQIALVLVIVLVLVFNRFGSSFGIDFSSYFLVFSAFGFGYWFGCHH